MGYAPAEVEALQVIRLVAALHRIQDNALQRFVHNLWGLTAGQVRVLMCLVPGEQTRTLELAARLYTDPGTISGLLRRLVHKNLIATRVAAGDRRVQLVSLTPRGEQVREECLRMVPEELPAMAYLTGLAPATRQALLTELRRYATHLVGSAEVDRLLQQWCEAVQAEPAPGV